MTSDRINLQAVRAIQINVDTAIAEEKRYYELKKRGIIKWNDSVHEKQYEDGLADRVKKEKAAHFDA